MIDNRKIGTWKNPVSGLADQPTQSASALKAVFDSNSNELKEALNGVIDDLKGTSGAENIGCGNTTVKGAIENLSGGISDTYTKTETDEKLSSKVDKEAGKSLSSNDYTDNEKLKLAGLPNETYSKTETDGKLENKVDKVSGKGLSSNDYTDAEKTKLAGIDEGANNYSHPASHSAVMIDETENRKFLTPDLKAMIENSAQFKGVAVSDSALPSSPQTGDMYKVSAQTVKNTKVYYEGALSTYDYCGTPVYGIAPYTALQGMLSAEEWTNLTTLWNECTDIYAFDVYNSNWVYITTINLSYYDCNDTPIANYTKPHLLTLGTYYYFVRANDVAVTATAPTHDFITKTVPEHIAIYNGTSWDMININEEESAKGWKLVSAGTVADECQAIQVISDNNIHSFSVTKTWIMLYFPLESAPSNAQYENTSMKQIRGELLKTGTVFTTLIAFSVDGVPKDGDAKYINIYMEALSNNRTVGEVSAYKGSEDYAAQSITRNVSARNVQITYPIKGIGVRTNGYFHPGVQYEIWGYEE